MNNRRNTANLDNHKSKKETMNNKNSNNFVQRYESTVKNNWKGRKKINEPAFFRIQNDSTIDSDNLVGSNQSYEK